jgi:hypothetical protein
MLHCEQCGCSGRRGVGWVSFVRSEPDDTDDRSWIGAYCPRCAEARFDYGRDAAEKHVCVSDTPQTDVTGRSLRQGEGTLRAAIRRLGEADQISMWSLFRGEAQTSAGRDSEPVSP